MNEQEIEKRILICDELEIIEKKPKKIETTYNGDFGLMNSTLVTLQTIWLKIQELKGITDVRD